MSYDQTSVIAREESGRCRHRWFSVELTFPKAHPGCGSAASSTDFSPVCLDWSTSWFLLGAEHLFLSGRLSLERPVLSTLLPRVFWLGGIRAAASCLDSPNFRVWSQPALWHLKCVSLPRCSVMDKCHAAEYGRARLADEERYSTPISIWNFLFSACSHLICLFSFFKQKKINLFLSLKWYMPNFPPVVMHL